jgi:alpha-tubulin suppressor-like RCC1 family protein
LNPLTQRRVGALACALVPLALAGGCQLIAGLDDTGPASTSSGATSTTGTGGAGGTTSTGGGSPSSSSASGGGPPCAPAPGKILAVTAGDVHTCALIEEQTKRAVYCWGDNQETQLGVGGQPAFSSKPAIAEIVNIQPTVIAAGQTFTCASAGDSNVTCWGSAAGVADTNSSTPFTLQGAVQHLMGGGDIACAITDEPTAWCWGFIPWINTVVGAQRIMSNISVAALGGGHFCYRSGGAVECLGTNTFDECGIAAASPVMNPEVVANTQNTTRVFAGPADSCALGPMGLICWGDDADGQLDGKATMTPNPTPLANPYHDAFQHAALGENHTCSTDGATLDCWGANQLGQTGASGMAYKARHVLPGGFNFKGITAGSNHTCIWSSGEVRCWGANERGQCGRVGDASFDSSLPPLVCW